MLTPEIFEPIRGKVYRFVEDLRDDLVKLCASPEVPAYWGPEELLQYAKSRGACVEEVKDGHNTLRFR